MLKTKFFSILILTTTTSIMAATNNTVTKGINEKTENFELLILHTNDMHARFAETSELSGVCYRPPCYGGFARVSTIFKEARRNATTGHGPKNVLILNAGDTYTGSTFFTVYHSNITTEFINLLKFDALSLGNHEFDLGVSGLLPFIEGVESPIVCTNLDTTKEPQLTASKLKRSVTIDVNGIKVGIIGYLTNETKYISKAENTEFLYEVDAIKLESEKLNAEGVQILIAVGHSGYEVDKEIAARVPLIDIVVGGHSNTFLYTGGQPDVEVPEGPYPTIIQQPNGKRVPVVQAYAYTKYVGKLLVEFNDGNFVKASGNPILVTHDIEKDPIVEELLDKYRPGVEALRHQVIGRTKVLLDSRTCRYEECNLGNAVTDAFVLYHMDQYHGEFWTDAAIGLVNGGGIRSSLDGRSTGGNITQDDLLTTFPFGNIVQSTILTGQDLLDVLQHSANQYHLGGFLQVSGLHVVYDFSDRGNKRIESVKVRCASCLVPKYEPLVLDQKYKVIVTAFLMAGGDGFDMLKNKTFINEGIDDASITVEYLQKFSPITTGIEGRIIIKGLDNDDDSYEGRSSNSTKNLYLNIIVGCGIIVFILIGIISYLMYVRNRRQRFGLGF
ncbi:protein 5NUC-like [Chrysoperla carnea]|uniref:protein 5NUC-like n=1 Tax=Chrysoperla carnea TaxID=189513 RepID=UPI001D06C3A9|nr:protein 5NUC-like [Chrysoperla carnea]